VWLSDGIADDGAKALSETLAKLAKPGRFEFFTDTAGDGALALSMPQAIAEKGFGVRVRKAEMVARHGVVAAVTAKGERLAQVPFDIAAKDHSANVAVDLPLELRNQVARLEIVNEQSPAGVFLLDGRSQRRKVGILASEDVEEAQPLLTPSHYLE